jgi:hypothetical protein
VHQCPVHESGSLVRDEVTPRSHSVPSGHAHGPHCHSHSQPPIRRSRNGHSDGHYPCIKEAVPLGQHTAVGCPAPQPQPHANSQVSWTVTQYASANAVRADPCRPVSQSLLPSSLEPHTHASPSKKAVKFRASAPSERPRPTPQVTLHPSQHPHSHPLHWVDRVQPHSRPPHAVQLHSGHPHPTQPPQSSHPAHSAHLAHPRAQYPVYPTRIPPDATNPQTSPVRDSPSFAGIHVSKPYARPERAHRPRSEPLKRTHARHAASSPSVSTASGHSAPPLPKSRNSYHSHSHSDPSGINHLELVPTSATRCNVNSLLNPVNSK